jgi:DNA-binding winged helix-turn-helix (wHTH) protein/tetratricopeptide (TPR) repeat protein
MLIPISESLLPDKRFSRYEMKRFQSFRLDTANQCLWQGEARVDMAPKAFDVLRFLVERAGRLVTPEEILEALWAGTYVNPEGLRKYIQEIRKVLGDRADRPIFIATLPKRGYQFVAPIIEESTAKPLDLPAEAAKEIVGRELSLADLNHYLRKAVRGQRQIVFVTGEGGIGKTTLVDEFQRQAAANVVSIRIARGQCVEGYGGKEPYYPMLEALSGLCRGPAGKSLVQTLAAQAPTWLVQFPALVKREHRETLQREILGATRERMLREIGEALETITSENPLLLVFDDLHWADHSTVDLISAVARRRGAAKLMVIGTYRPVEVIVSEHPLHVLKQDLQVHQLCREIALEPLGEAEVAKYLVAMSSGASLPDGLASLLYRHSEGNPLFMVTALNDMTERGLISRGEGNWQLRDSLKGFDLEVPKSLQQMIEVQINRLSPEEKRVLEVSSLESVGRSRFTVVSRAPVIDLDPEVFEDVCETLSRRHCIVRSAAPQKFADGTVSASYEFVHALYRQVCYRRIAPARRAMLHRRLGDWVEAHLLKPVDQTAAWLAFHFEQGRDWLRAIKYLQLAADTAGRRFVPRQAAEILKHALDLVEKLPEADRSVSEIELLEKLATIYVVLVDDVHAIESYESMAARAARDGLIDVEARALIDMAYPLSWSSSQCSLVVLERALWLSARQQDPSLGAKTRARCFAQRLWQRWNPQDVEEFDNAFAQVLNTNSRRTLVPYYADRGFVSWIASEYREARRCFIESRVINLETVAENPYLSGPYLIGQCIVLPKNLLFLGEWGEALREIKDVTAMLDKNADYLWGQVVNLNRAWLHLHAMDFAGALAICNSTLPLVRHPELRPTPDFPTPRPVIRLCLFLMGSAETALGHYESAFEHLLLERADMDQPAIFFGWYGRMQLEAAFTELWLAKGDLSQARPQAETFLKIALETAEHTWQALAWEVNARVALAELDLTRAQDCIVKGLSAMEGFEVPLGAWRLHATAAELYQLTKSRELAERHLALSRDTIMKLANSLLAEEPLRHIFLSAPVIHKILGDSEAKRKMH